MVGVPRSKACSACRARRKGCDARLPSCSQCLHRGVKCPGYAKDLKIVLVQPGTKIYASSTTGASKSVSQPLITSSTSINPALVQLLPSLLSTAFRSQTYDRFITDYAPHSVNKWPRLPSNLSVLPSTMWIPSAASVAQSDPVLNNALTALALAQVGRTTGRPDLHIGSQKVYTQALSGLNRRLRDGEDSFTDTTLAAIAALSIYEMQEGSVESRSKSWASHVKGASAIVQMRGKANFSSPLSNRIFLGVQITEFIASVGSQNPASNASLWSRTFQDFMPDSDFVSPMRLFEALTGLPQIMKVAGRICPDESAGQQPNEETEDLLESLINQCQDFETRLKKWYGDLESRHLSKYEQDQPSPGSTSSNSVSEEVITALPKLYSFEPSTLYRKLPYDSPKRIFPFFICFVDPDIALQTVLYWASLLLMHSTLLVTLGRLGPGSIGTSRIRNFTSSHKAQALALLITQSLEYFVHPDMGFMGTNVIGFPLSVAHGFFQHAGTDELLWFEVIFQRMSDLKSGLSGFLDDMAKRRTLKLAGYTWRRRV